jgi:hypothetical protein
MMHRMRQVWRPFCVSIRAVACTWSAQFPYCSYNTSPRSAQANRAACEWVSPARFATRSASRNRRSASATSSSSFATMPSRPPPRCGVQLPVLLGVAGHSFSPETRDHHWLSVGWGVRRDRKSRTDPDVVDVRRHQVPPLLVAHVGGELGAHRRGVVGVRGPQPQCLVGTARRRSAYRRG